MEINLLFHKVMFELVCQTDKCVCIFLFFLSVIYLYARTHIYVYIKFILISYKEVKHTNPLYNIHDIFTIRV